MLSLATGGEGVATRQKEGWKRFPPFTVTDVLAKAIEDVHFTLRFPNRTEALRAILEAGVKVLKQEAPPW